MAAALEEDIVDSGEVMQVPAKLKIGRRIIREAHKRRKGETDRRTVDEIIQKSLNVGTSMISLELGKQRLHKYCNLFGFGHYTGIDLPGESKGILRPYKKWRKVDEATISFGQGIAVTPLQIAAAVGIIANKGIHIQPRIINYITNSKDTTMKAPGFSSRGRIISRETSEKVLKMMRGVVVDGTAPLVEIPGYNPGGKTGTAQKPAPGGGYLKDKYIASFIGVFPVDDPEYLVFASVDSPEKSIYGSTIAGPIFKNIAPKKTHDLEELFRVC